MRLPFSCPGEWMSIDESPAIYLILKLNASFSFRVWVVFLIQGLGSLWIVYGNETEYRTVRVTVEVYWECFWFNVPIGVRTILKWPKIKIQRTLWLETSTQAHPSILYYFSFKLPELQNWIRNQINLDTFLSGAVSPVKDVNNTVILYVFAPVNYSDPDPEFGNEKCIFLSIYIDSDSDTKFGHGIMHLFFFFFRNSKFPDTDSIDR